MSLKSRKPKRQAGQYGSLGLRADGTTCNVGNKFGERPCIRLHPEYNSGSALKAALFNITEPTPSTKPTSSTKLTSSASAIPVVKAAAAPPLHVHKAATGAKIDPFIQSQLIEAVKQGRKKLVKQALLDGADVNASMEGDAATHWTALHFAAASGNGSVVKFLMHSCGANRDAKDTSGQTPADVASKPYIRGIILGTN